MGGAEAKIKLSEYGHVAYQIKADKAGSNMVANILPKDTPLTQGVGSKGQTLYFSESSHVALFVCLFDLILYVPSTIFQL